MTAAIIYPGAEPTRAAAKSVRSEYEAFARRFPFALRLFKMHVFFHLWRFVFDSLRAANSGGRGAGCKVPLVERFSTPGQSRAHLSGHNCADPAPLHSATA